MTPGKLLAAAQVEAENQAAGVELSEQCVAAVALVLSHAIQAPSEPLSPPGGAGRGSVWLERWRPGMLAIDAGWWSCPALHFKRSGYDLLIDERQPDVQVRGRRGVLSVSWESLQPRHRKLLGLVVTAMAGGQDISLDRIGRVALGREGSVHNRSLRRCVQRTVCELGKVFQGALNGLLVADRCMDGYRIERRLSYAWIRPEPDRSRLGLQPEKNS